MNEEKKTENKSKNCFRMLENVSADNSILHLLIFIYQIIYRFLLFSNPGHWNCWEQKFIFRLRAINSQAQQIFHSIATMTKKEHCLSSVDVCVYMFVYVPENIE